jgi:DNA replication licensing factor MCM7
MAVHLLGHLTRSCAAGDIVTLTGVFLPTPYSGWQALKAGLIADTYLQAMNIAQKKISYSALGVNDRMLREIVRISKERGIYERLASSIAPEIFGHEDVKKALLLLMVGASTRVLPDGMRIRGDLNICLMGDPGVAKSQVSFQTTICCALSKCLVV